MYLKVLISTVSTLKHINFTAKKKVPASCAQTLPMVLPAEDFKARKLLDYYKLVEAYEMSLCNSLDRTKE